MMPVNDPKAVAEVTAAFQSYETALNDNDVAALAALSWKSPLTIRFGLAENLYGHDAITAFRQARPNVDIGRSISKTVITTYGSDFATANTEFTKRDSDRCGRQSQIWMRTEAGWRVVTAHVSFLPAQD
jgi:ketosteroid isomerase-like protein